MNEIRHSILYCKFFYAVLAILLVPMFASCDNLFDDLEPKYNSDDTGLVIQKYASAYYSCQSMASYGDYAFIVSDKLSSIGLYDLKKKREIYKENLPAQEEKTPTGGTLYHCNQSSFSTYKYDPNDDFPVLYISQRFDKSMRCKIMGMRIIAGRDSIGKISSFSTELVQTIFMPAMSEANAMGNANVVFDSEHHRMITYSRNNNKTDANYLKCRISVFDIPDLSQDTIYLEDSDIRDSYEIDCSALNMQGGAIYADKLYIGQGYQSCGFINVQVVDLIKRELQITYDLLAMGVTWEPEGCTVYKDKLYIHASSRLWEFPNIFTLTNNATRSYMPIGYLIDE